MKEDLWDLVIIQPKTPDKNIRNKFWSMCEALKEQEYTRRFIDDSRNGEFQYTYEHHRPDYELAAIPDVIAGCERLGGVVEYHGPIRWFGKNGLPEK